MVAVADGDAAVLARLCDRDASLLTALGLGSSMPASASWR
jgi:hypothetical protein